MVRRLLPIRYSILLDRGGELQIVRSDRVRKRRGVDSVEAEKALGIASRFVRRQRPERGFVGSFRVKGREEGNSRGFGEVRMRGTEVSFQPVAQQIGRVGELLRETFFFFLCRRRDAAADRLARGGVRFDAAFRNRKIREVFGYRSREEAFGRREFQCVAHSVVPISANFRMRKHGHPAVGKETVKKNGNRTL